MAAMEALAMAPPPVLSLSPHHHRRISTLSSSFVHHSSHRVSLSPTLSPPLSDRHRSAIRCSSASSPSLAEAVNNSAKFIEASKKGNLIPLYKCVFSDDLTPVLAYRCLVKEDDRESPSFLFESVEPGSTTSSVGRYGAVGAQPSMEIVAKENLVTVMDHHEGKRTEEFVDDPMSLAKKIMDEWKPQLIDELPDAFCGGWVGYFSYDTVRYVETKKLPFSNATYDDKGLPDVHLGLYDDVIVFDHVEKVSLRRSQLAASIFVRIHL